MEMLWAIGKIVLFIAGIGLSIYVYLLFMRGLNQIPDRNEPSDKEHNEKN